MLLTQQQNFISRIFWLMFHSVFNQLFVKILIQLHLVRLGPKKVVLFPETGQVEKLLSLTRSHSRMCIWIYVFYFKNQTSHKKKQKKQNKARIKRKKEKKQRRKDNISGKLIKKINLRPSGWRFFSPLAFPETRVWCIFGLIVLYCTVLDSHVLVAPNLIN